MLIKIDKKSPLPIYRQIVDGTKTLIDQDIIEVGKPLPSTRKLAASLGVSRPTVYQAYEELQALGYTRSRPGSYHVVQKRRKEAEYDPERRSIIPWGKSSTEPAQRVFERYIHGKPNTCDLIFLPAYYMRWFLSHIKFHRALQKSYQNESLRAMRSNLNARKTRLPRSLQGLAMTID